MVVAIAAGERGREKGKNPTKFSETINLPYNDRPYRKYIYKKTPFVMDYELSIIIFKYTIKQSELKQHH